MPSLREELLAAAQRAVRDDLLRRLPFQGRSRQFAVVLGGSGVTEDCDEYSGCDLIVFRLAPSGHGSGRDDRSMHRWHNVRHGPHRYRYAMLDLETFRQAAERGDDSALYLLRHGQLLHDPQARLRALWRRPPEPRPEDWTRKLAERYRAFRLRRASLAWSLRRGQPVAVLENLRLMLEHALSCCFYLRHEPAPPRKWIFRSALRTPAGRRLREPVLQLLSCLGELAVLGGSLNLRHNRLYQGVRRLQDALEQVLIDAGLPVPGLAALAGEVEVGPGEALPWEGPDFRAPRVRPGRRARRRQPAPAASPGGSLSLPDAAAADDVAPPTPGQPD